MTDIFTTEHDESPQPERRRKRLSKPVAIVMIAIAVLVGVALLVAAIVGVYAASLARSFDERTTKIEQAFPDESTRPEASDEGAVNILLMGSDSRADATELDDEGPSDQRTDTMMLVHVDADRQNVYAMSIMRDLYVPIPGWGEAKINSAFAYGGSPLTVHTVEQLTGARIDHVAIIDFEGFKGMTDALGGVDLVSPREFTARGTKIQVGQNHLDGEDALDFVRERYSFTDGDYTRVANQQLFLKAIVDEVISQDTLTDPGKISAFVDSVSDYLTVDDTLDAGTIASLGLSLRSVRSSDIHFFTIPTSGTGMVGSQSVVFTAEDKMSVLQQALRDDNLEAHLPTLVR